jgi:lactate permease
VLTGLAIIWGLPVVKARLNIWGTIKFNIPGLHNRILSSVDHQPIAQTFTLGYLSAAGTAILISALLSVWLIGMRFREAANIFLETLKQLKFPIITIACILGFAYIANNSGLSNTLAAVLANTGVLFPFFAPVLGWLGVFITGSDTSSNALFSRLQRTTATTIGIDPVITVAGNTSGGVVGKMISPQSIAVAAASGGLIGQESRLFRFTVKHSFIMLILICIIVILQAYVFTWMVPVYNKL